MSSSKPQEVLDLMSSEYCTTSSSELTTVAKSRPRRQQPAVAGVRRTRYRVVYVDVRGVRERDSAFLDIW